MMTHHDPAHHDSGITGTPPSGGNSLRRAERVVVLLFACMALCVLLGVGVLLVFVKEQSDAQCFRHNLVVRAAIGQRDTQLQDQFDKAFGQTLAELLKRDSTVESRTKAVADLLAAERVHEKERAKDDADRKANPISGHC
jgi:hypothetical protein